MPPLPSVRPREVVRALERAGFVRVGQVGNHLHLKRNAFKVSVPMHNRDMKTGTLRGIIRQTGLTVEEFLELLRE